MRFTHFHIHIDRLRLLHAPPKSTPHFIWADKYRQWDGPSDGSSLPSPQSFEYRTRYAAHLEQDLL